MSLQPPKNNKSCAKSQNTSADDRDLESLGSSVLKQHSGEKHNVYHNYVMFYTNIYIIMCLCVLCLKPHLVKHLIHTIFLALAGGEGGCSGGKGGGGYWGYITEGLNPHGQFQTYITFMAELLKVWSSHLGGYYLLSLFCSLELSLFGYLFAWEMAMLASFGWP